jgi:hypothetical protein
MALKSPHGRAKFATERDEVESTLDRATLEGVEAATSGHLVRLGDIFYALVLVQGILRYEEVFQTPWNDNAAVILALVTIYYTAIRSFIGWHIAQEARRYRIFASTAKTTELWRVYVDIAIGALYLYMLFSAEALKERADADIGPFLAAFVMLFALYLIWGYLRRVAWGHDKYASAVLWTFTVLYALLWWAYAHGPEPWSMETMNVVALVLALLLMMGFRYINWRQAGALDTSKPPAQGLRPGVPSLEVSPRPEPSPADIGAVPRL